MNEIVCNLHIHSTYSDGSGTYSSITEAALQTDVQAIILTDHNIHVEGLEGYHSKNGRKVLVLSGEEVHDQNRNPQKNHTLVIGAEKEMAGFANEPQILINEVRKAGGLSFIAHPYEFDLPLINEPDISWVDWSVEGFTGLELWNGMSEFKTVSRTLTSALKHLYMPELVAHHPLPAALQKWDELLCSGKKISVVGGSDAHAIKVNKGPIKRIAYPYEYHFSAINNHLLLKDDLNGNLPHDKAIIYDSLRRGSSFIGYDLPASTRGASFMIENEEGEFFPGDTFGIDSGATVRVTLPENAHMRLIHNGKVVHEVQNGNRLLYTVSKPGYYRLECLLYFIGKERGWIYTNPIYAVENHKRKVL